MLASSSSKIAVPQQSWFVHFIAALIVVISAFVLLGWWIKSVEIVQLLPNLVSMKFNAALGFLLAGLSLGFAKNRNPWGVFAAIASGMIGLLTLSQYILGVNLGVDELFVQDFTANVGTSHPGRMAPNTAIGLVLCAVAVVSIRTLYAVCLSLALLTIAAATLTGYVSGIQSAYGIGKATNMAFHTSVVFLLLSLAIAFQSIQYLKMKIQFSMLLALLFAFLAAVNVLVWRYLVVHENAKVAIITQKQLDLSHAEIVSKLNATNHLIQSLYSVKPNTKTESAQLALTMLPAYRFSVELIPLAPRGASHGNLHINDPSIAPKALSAWLKLLSARIATEVNTTLVRKFVDNWYYMVTQPSTPKRYFVTSLDLQLLVSEALESGLSKKFLFELYVNRELIVSTFDSTSKQLSKTLAFDFNGEAFALHIAPTVEHANSARSIAPELAFFLMLVLAQVTVLLVYLIQLSRKSNQLGSPPFRTTTLSVFDAVPANIAIIDQQGVIIHINHQWKEFALENNVEDIQKVSVGYNYFDAIDPSYPKTEVGVSGIVKVLNGELPKFDYEYPCHSPSQERWFLMRVVPLLGEQKGAVLTHIDISEQKRAGVELKLLNARFERAMNGIQEGLFEWDVVSKKLYQSPSLKNLTGIDTTDSHYFAAVIERAHPDDRADLEEKFDHALHNEGGFSARFRLQVGSVYRWCYIRANTQKDESGGRWFVSGTLNDIDEDEQLNQALKASLEEQLNTEKEKARFQTQYERLYDTTSELLCSISVSDGLIIRCNQSFVARLGYSREEILGCHFTSVVSPESIADSLELFALFSKTGHVEKQEIALLCSDGSKVFVVFNAVGLQNERGELELAWVTFWDITAIKSADIALQQSNVFLDSVIENIPDMVFLKEAENLRFTLLNRAGETLLGHPKEVFIGKNDYDFFPVEQADFFVEKDREVLAKKDILDIKEEEITTASGVRILHTKKVPLLDAQGDPKYLLGISVDITEQKESQERESRFQKVLMSQAQVLQEKNKELQNFVFIASHDLREPLRKITAYTELLMEDFAAALPKDAKMYMGRVVASAKRMDGLIDSLLKYSRVSTQGRQFVPVDLNLTVKDVIEDLALLVSETKTKITCVGLPTIQADPQQMRQLFQNLISNSIKFRQADRVPEIQIRAEVLLQEEVKQYWNDGAECERYRVTVADNGIGFNEKYNNIVFEIFKRLHSRDEYPGTGIGLALCKKIVTR